MINSIVIPTIDINEAEFFYGSFLNLFGASKHLKRENLVSWKNRDKSISIIIQKVSGCVDLEANKTIIGFTASSPFEVELIYKAALRFGAVCAGSPSDNGYGNYSAYIYDLDRNKLGIFYIKNNPL